MGDIEIIIDKIQLFEKTYDFMMVVDPIRKKVLKVEKGSLFKDDIECYKLLEKQTMCENCISMRAYNENECIIKLTYSKNKIYMMTAVPIISQGEKLIIELFKDATNSLYMQNEEHGCEMKVISSIKHFKKLAKKDELTDLYNRRFIYERLPADLSKSFLKNEPLSLIFIDIDFFKKVNDKYGHVAGDQVLREVGEELARNVRAEKDWVARYGGEEFIICLTNTDIDNAHMIAERIRNNIMAKEFIIGNDRLNLTCSFGVHTVNNEDECPTVDSIIDIVDKKLYRAKAEGRNKIV